MDERAEVGDGRMLVTQDEGEEPFGSTAPERSVGLVRTQYLQVPDMLALECGRTLGNLTIAYETYGALNERRDNAVLLCHALSGDAHAAGYHTPRDRRPGWFDDMVGPGKAFDTRRYFVICS